VSNVENYLGDIGGDMFQGTVFSTEPTPPPPKKRGVGTNWTGTWYVPTMCLCMRGDGAGAGAEWQSRVLSSLPSALGFLAISRVAAPLSSIPFVRVSYYSYS